MIRTLIAVAFVVAGMLLGALNPQPVVVDLGRAGISTTLGVALLVALLIGVLLGGLILALSNLLPGGRRGTIAGRRQAVTEQQEIRERHPAGGVDR